MAIPSSNGYRDELPFVSVVVLNFDGRKILNDCLLAISRLNYPAEKYEIVVVDNCSIDESIEKAKASFPQVKYIINKGNLGFASGYNQFLRSATSEYVALVNNDARPDQNWLLHLVECAISGNRIGAVTSKILFEQRVIPIAINSSALRASGEVDINRGVRIYSLLVNENEVLDSLNQVQDVLGIERDGNQVFRWAAPRSLLPIPIDLDMKIPEEKIRISIKIWSPISQSISFGYPLSNLSTTILHKGHNFLAFEVDQLTETRVINNAGSLLLSDGSGADRGFKEIDLKQFDSIESVFGFCGASVLLSGKMLKEVGVFADDFFMYYEDTDLSWRMRSQDWDIVYCPSAVMFHKHAFSSGEGSSFFNFYVRRNRLLMIMRNGSRKLAFRELSIFILGRMYSLFKFPRAIITANNGFIGNEKTNQKVLFSLLFSLPNVFAQRRKIIREATFDSVEFSWVKPKSWWIKRKVTSETYKGLPLIFRQNETS
jgi:GT2 family glycosyltransferase